ncbi:hypothetical protein [Winogradskyella sp.]|uniref:hypothetical protein n=1 Tax=Winogradskyella sp. TaxID=1883156 RepID=UPI00261B31BB|nr:hypothetical protein [Winogradskyella sp.]
MDWVYKYKSLYSFRVSSTNDPSILFKVHWKLNTTEVHKEVANGILNFWGLKQKNY